ncbi:MAG: BREX-2 system adenine-specific DNA-methyltransferase PglX, partial [Actinobacteria bacterium]|nr:BREX-2 system adenine-specific DNA-methyltransferase PglX [Actinomycetota bacterium]
GSRMIDRKQLLAGLRGEVVRLEGDLREQVGAVEGLERRLRGEHAAATKARRTSATWASWHDEQITQAAVAWVLGTVFVRWCEDNALIDPVLSGPGERLGAAEDAQLAYFRAHPHRTDADWLRAAFDVLAASDAGAMLFDARHNPAYLIPVSHDGAKALIGFWRARRGDGSLVHDFRDPGWDTRFLGDLYQDLSDEAKDRYALLQTPEFVEEFILDLTLTPAIEEFGLHGLRVIDPTCGSGHFLLGTFHRLVDAWREQAPALDPYELTRRALDSVHGVDLNPFAVAISRFRLLVAAWRAAGVRTVAEAAGHRWRMAVATGDSLLPVERQQSIAEVDEQLDYRAPFEDVHEFALEGLLHPGGYHAVVGNPPYITVKDKTLNAEYRAMYDACSGKYALTVPFAQRFFQLSRPADDNRKAGFVGQITSNSFMKREFGAKLIEHFFPTVELSHVIDSSGAYIPGHGTPTVILIGRRRHPRNEGIRAVLGIRGEPSQPAEPSKGLVWTAIASQVDRPGSESDWVGVQDLERSSLSTFPWVLLGGGGREMFYGMDDQPGRVGDTTKRIGFFGIMGSDPNPRVVA